MEHLLHLVEQAALHHEDDEREHDGVEQGAGAAALDALECSVQIARVIDAGASLRPGRRRSAAGASRVAALLAAPLLTRWLLRNTFV